MRGAMVTAGMLVWLLVPAAARAQEGNPILPPPVNVTQHIDVTVQPPPPDPSFVAESSVDGGVAMFAVVAPIPGQWLKSTVDHLPNLWTQTPPLPDGVRQVSNNLRQVSIALGALFIFLAGLAIVTGRTARLADDAFWRFVFATFVSFNNLTWWDAAISLNNQINSAIAQPDVARVLTDHLVTSFQSPTFTGITDATVAMLAGLALAVVLAVVGLLTLLTLLTRLALIYVLAGAGALVLFLFALPQLEGTARWYVRFAMGTLFSQIGITIGFATASAIVAFGTDKTVAVLLAIVVLLVVRRIPSIMQQVGSGAGQGLFGAGALAVGVRMLLRGA